MELGSGIARIPTQVCSTQNAFLPLDRQEAILVRPQRYVLLPQIILGFLSQVTAEQPPTNEGWALTFPCGRLLPWDPVTWKHLYLLLTQPLCPPSFSRMANPDEQK